MLEEWKNKQYLHENDIHFPKEQRFIVLLLRRGRCERTLYLFVQFNPVYALTHF